tara:strand:- start:1024 stop:1980 length:957 start_codon:yes stop_codon:yes gene_type:complete
MVEILKIENLTKIFEKKSVFRAEKTIVKATDNITFTLNQGEILAIAGESGSGKSTLAKLILRAIEPDSGKIFFENEEISNTNLKKIRMQCQMVYQDPYDSINPRMKIQQIINEPLEIHGYGASERKNLIIDALKQVKLEPTDEIIEKYPHMLSGGQRQRVVLARALVLKPKVIIADEPVSMLDVSIRAEILELMKEIQKKNNISFIYITHDLATAKHFADRIMILYLGKIMEDGPVDHVILKPKHPYTQALIDAISEPNPDNLYNEKKVRINDPINVDVYNGCRFYSRCPYAEEKCKQEPILESIDNKRSVSCFFPLD